MKGVYILIILIIRNTKIKVGALGEIKFTKGVYAYVGSAQNNLEKRIKRHLTKNKKKFWHIDYLTANKFVKIVKVFYKLARKSEECRTAEKLRKTEIPIKNFGCSDCNCESHLFKIRSKNIADNGWKSWKLIELNH
ncbi:MAG: GIY-YIG nuclease family protein [Candidatus Aenigmatarchaeota archaeon]|nr:MAG: GIY-YIG nuclease family protein [Candidatus Aenigmarchaeota archaeon]